MLLDDFLAFWNCQTSKSFDSWRKTFVYFTILIRVQYSSPNKTVNLILKARQNDRRIDEQHE